MARTVQLCFRIPRDHWEDISRVARNAGKNVGDVVQDAVMRYIRDSGENAELVVPYTEYRDASETIPKTAWFGKDEARAVREWSRRNKRNLRWIFQNAIARELKGAY